MQYTKKNDIRIYQYTNGHHNSMQPGIFSLWVLKLSYTIWLQGILMTEADVVNFRSRRKKIIHIGKFQRSSLVAERFPLCFRVPINDLNTTAHFFYNVQRQ